MIEIIGLIMLSLFLSLYLGNIFAEHRWKSYSKSMPGHYSGGKIYHVIREDDNEKWDRWIKIYNSTKIDDDSNDADENQDVCPACGKPLTVKWSGVECSYCGYWECL